MPHVHEKPPARLQQKLPPAGIPSRGKVQRLYPERGFGFIKCLTGAPDDIGQDFFFHYSGLEDCAITDLEEAQPVTFIPTYPVKGRRAEHIQREGA